jgi:galactosylceramidase
VWNERQYSLELPRNNEWIKLLAQEIRSHQLKTRIIASDEVGGLTVGHEMMKDPQLLDAVDVLGTHYQDWNPKGFDNQIVRQTGKTVWSSEDGPWRGDWTGAGSLARKFNRNYLLFGMTKTIIWSLVTSYYDILPIAGSGVMKANTPWSGHYEIQPALWAVAHFTHFIQPGWKYLDAACGFSSDSTSSFTSLLSADGQEMSMMVETVAAKSDFSLDISLAQEFSKREFFLWKSDSARQFIRVKKIKPVKGRIQITFQRNCIFTLTTVTRPDMPPAPAIAPEKSFALPYSDNFENYLPEVLPKYTQDQAGVFEVKMVAGNKVLQQTIPGIGIEWNSRLNPDPFTVLGDTLLTDYSVSIDAKIEGPEWYAAVYGRVNRVIQNNIEPPLSYWFRVHGDGTWQLGKTGGVLKQGNVNLQKSWPSILLSFNDHTRNAVRLNYSDISRMDAKVRDIFPDLPGYLKDRQNRESLNLVVSREGNYYICRDNILQSGHASLDPAGWNTLKLKMQGDRISALLNGQTLTTVTDNSYSHGLAGFGCSWHPLTFDNLMLDLIR